MKSLQVVSFILAFLGFLSPNLCFSLGQTPNEFEPANAVTTFGLTLKEYIQ